MKTDRRTGLKVFMKHLGEITDVEAVEKSYDVSTTDDKFAQSVSSLEGIKAVIDSLGERTHDARPTDFVELRYVKDLEDSGFVNALYKRP